MPLTLRKYQHSDADSIVEIFNDPEITANLNDLPSPYTHQDAMDWFKLQETSPDHVFAIEYEGLYIGSVGFHHKTDVYRLTYDAGYYVAKSHWGKGIATAALKSGCAYMFENTEAARIQAGIYAHNRGSRRVAEKSGFTLESVMRNAAIKNGELIDLAMYVLLRP